MKCPKCGAENRPGARFCTVCGAPLPRAATVKLCPQCKRENRLGAKFCTYCGYTFSAPAGASPLRRLLWAGGAGLAAIGLVASGVLLLSRGRGEPAATSSPTAPAIAAAPTDTPLLAAPTATIPAPTSTPVPPTATAAPSPTAPFSAALERALLSTVQIIVPMDWTGGNSTGSGSILTAHGHILTNWHVVGNPTTGEPYNSAGQIYVAVNPPNLKDPPQAKYRARIVQADYNLDLVLIKIVASSDGRALSGDLGLPTMPVGDSDTVKIGDELSIIGFPGLGGTTVTYTKGSVSGFLSDEGWIKTDAELNPGNSGGAAIDREGKLVGVPSAAAADLVRMPGKIGLVRPINLARHLIELAQREAK